MKCTRPTQFQPNGQYLSCGQCMPCRITRRLEWQTRLILEYKNTNMGVFVTLTYSPENLPHSDIYSGGSLDKTHLQAFIMRFRRNYQYKYGDREIRYFAVGEYGDISQRAHYHLIIFGVQALPADEIIKKSWKLGHTMSDEINPNRIKYITGYTIKKMTSTECYDNEQTPEFSIMSKHPALGSYALPAFAEHLNKHNKKSTTHLTALQKFLLETDNHLDVLDFNGYFKHKGKWLKLDRTMLKNLGKLQLDKYDYLAETIDNTHTILPYNYRIRLNRLHDDSKIAKIKSYLTGEQYETQKKADKTERSHYKTRKI